MPAWFTRELSFGDTGDDVRVLQRRIDAPVTGVFDRDTEARVLGVQRSVGVDETGVVDEVTAEAVGETPSQGLVPEWFVRELKLGDHGVDVGAARKRLGLPHVPLNFDAEVEAAVRMVQSSRSVNPTGVINEEFARLLGDQP